VSGGHLKALDPLDYGLPPILERLSPADRAALHGAATRVRFADGQPMYGPEDWGAHFCVLLEGGLRLIRIRSDGKRVSMGLWGPGHHFGHAPSALSRERNYVVIAVGEAVIGRISLASLSRLLDQRPTFTRVLLEVTTRRLAVLMDMLDDVRLFTPAVRVGRLLLHSLRREGGNDVICCLQEDIGQTLGISGMTVAQALRELSALGLVQTGYRSVRLPDPDKLSAWLASHDI
jgi:CRP/FNR family transcriptional regulator